MYNVFKATCVVLPELAEVLLADQHDELLEGHGSQANNFYQQLTAFDRDIKELFLPGFVQAREGVFIEMRHLQGSKPFGYSQHTDHSN